MTLVQELGWNSTSKRHTEPTPVSSQEETKNTETKSPS